jgi:hypothetical protein
VGWASALLQLFVALSLVESSHLRGSQPHTAQRRSCDLSRFEFLREGTVLLGKLGDGALLYFKFLSRLCIKRGCVRI